MDARLILVVVCAWAVCHVTHAQLQKPLNLLSNINLTDCGTSKLCVWNIANCDPSGNSSCFFSSIEMVNQTAVIQLSGTTSGYVGLGLTGNQSEGNIVFICGNSNDSNPNNTLFFNTFTQNGTTMTPANVSSVINVQGLVKQNLIQCTFTISTNLTINNDKNMIISNTTAFSIKLLTGNTNGTNLGEASPVISSTPVSLTKPIVLSNPPIPSPPTNATTNTTQPPINITRDGCSISKLCVSTPSACEPAGSNCTFASFKVTNQTLFCELSGRSPGYIALALTLQNSTSAFICSNNNNSGNFLFQTATLNGTALTSTNLNSVYSFQGQVTENQTLIQCKFNTSISNNSSYTVTLLSGTKLEKANILFTKSLNLASPSEPSTTIMPGAPTTSAGNSVVSRWTEVMAFLLSAMSLYFVTSPSP